jgi:hypothetical protein
VLIYIAGPLSAACAPCDAAAQFNNVKRVLDAATIVAKAGHTPFVPHLYWFWATMHPSSLGREDWMRMDFEMLDRCDLLIRLPGESSGSDLEVARARKQGLDVFVLEKDSDLLNVFVRLEET